MPKAYQVQFTLPVDNPVDNVYKTVRKQVIHFEVPINFPDMHNVGYAKLIEVAKDEKCSDLSPPLKNKKIDKEK